jgi:PBP1b-binding outer membrane lipoprotein LpoB
MKKLIVVLISCLFFTGCNKDAQVNAFVKEFDKATSEMVEKFDEGDVDGAKKVLDEEKPDLRAKWLSINNIAEYQVDEAIKKKAEIETKKSMAALVKSANQAINKYPNQKAKIQDIVDNLTYVVR